MIPRSTEDAFAEYEAVRQALPPVRPQPRAPVHCGTLEDIAEQFDVFLLDAFGVLNIGEAAIPGAPERVAALIAAGKRVLVVSNAASMRKEALVRKYRRLGFPFEARDVISSRDALIAGLRTQDERHWGVMASEEDDLNDLGPERLTNLGDDPAPYGTVGGMLLVGSGGWSEARQARLEQALRANPRPVCVGNPDIVAPRETHFSPEPGHYAHRLRASARIVPRFYGKPFAGIFELAFARLGPVDRARVVMVGDTLHTDILGAHTAGIASALVAGFGFFAGSDARAAIRQSGIQPTYVLTGP